ncbi:MAG: low specificity L-threonine aldolase [Pseudomonadota bacterium]
MFFASDNTGPIPPRIMEALIQANTGHVMPYGDDPIMEKVRVKIREIFEAPEAAVYLVATGTAANALVLATLAKPWETIFGHEISHIAEDECGAPEFYSNGAKITLVPGEAARMDPDALRAAIRQSGSKGVHSVQRGPVSITQATEAGTIYALSEIGALTEIAREFGLKTHLDGARFANALVALDCTPAEMTWKAGIDAVVFGGTKNGLLGVEAVIFFDPDHAWEFELLRKRGGHLFSKHRYLSAQMDAYLTDGFWLDLARKANANMRRLSDGQRGIPGISFEHEPQANLLFVNMPRAAHERATNAGAQYYLFPSSGVPPEEADDDPITCRLTCSWSLQADQIDRFLHLVRG